MCGDSTVSHEPCWKFDNKRDNLREIIADNLSKAGWSWGYVSAVDSEGRTIWIVDAHRDDGRRFVVHADERLTAFLELERLTRESLRFQDAERFGTILP
jgi:hypothetical protein